MRRVIYCPSNEFLDEATSLSKKNLLQIQLGESETTRNLSFDRGKVCVVEIPQFNYVEYKEVVQYGLHQIIDYRNDYISLRDNIYLKVSGNTFAPRLCEKHYVKFIFTCDAVGAFTAEIFDGHTGLESVAFDVR